MLRQTFRYVFKASRRIDVFHRAGERKGKGPVKIAEIFTDGIEGRVKVLDARFEKMIAPLFAEPQLEPMAPRRPPQKLKPWKRETVDHLVRHILPRFDLRAEVCDVQSK